MNALTLSYIAFGGGLHVLGAPRSVLRHLRPVGVFHPDWEAAWRATDRIRGHMHHAADSGEISAAVHQEVVGLCAYLFDEFVPLEAKRWIRSGSGALNLNLAPELLGLPWELFHTGHDFLCMQWALAQPAAGFRAYSMATTAAPGEIPEI